MALCFAAAAQARPALRWRTLATGAAGGVVTDGKRWAAYAPAAGVTRVIDTQTGRSYEHPDPLGCRPAFAVGGGAVLHECQGGPSAPYLMVDAATGAVHPVAGLDQVTPTADPTLCDPIEPSTIGARWAAVIIGCYHDSRMVFLDWRTGERAGEPLAAEGQPRYDVDLDAAQVARPLCRSMAAASSDITNLDMLGVLYVERAEGSFALAEAPSSQRPVLARCGMTRRVILGGPPQLGPLSVSLGGGVVVWPYPDAIYATRLDPHRRDWHGPVSRAQRHLDSQTAHAGGRIFQSHRRYGGRWTIWVTDVPPLARPTGGA